MTSFEFVFGLISVITSLALTQMLSGIVSLYRRSGRLQLSWRHALWTTTAFLLLIGNWSALWGLHDVQAWSPLDVMMPVLYTSVLYAFCDLMMPDRPADGSVLDLREFHVTEGKRYKLLQLVFAALILTEFTRKASSLSEWFGMADFAIVAAIIGIVAYRARSVWLDTATSLFFTLMAVVFVVVKLRVLSA